jgi:uncharacterized repeat protein (TIGR02543 family)
LSGSGTSERWQTSQTVSGTVSSSSPTTAGGSLTFTYYNQYSDTLSYSISGGGTGYSAPTLTGTEFGSAYTPSLTGTATAYWLDSGSSWSVTNLLSGSSSSERWDTSQTTSGTVSATQTIAYTYYNQYSIIFQYSVSGSGSGYSAPTVTYTQFGTGGQTVTAVTSGGTAVWDDAGTTYSYTNPLSGSSSSEQWATSSATGTASASTTVSKTYYNQYSFTLSYSVSGGGSGYSAPTLTGTQFGSAYTPSLTGTATAYWLDSGSAWSVTNPLSGSSTSERWDSSQTASGTVSSSSPTTAGGTLTFTYYNQYSFQLDYAVSGGGSPTAPTLTATQFGSSYVPTLGTSLTTYWLDSGKSWSVTNPLVGSGSNERWDSGQTVSSTVSSSSPTTAGGTLTFTYYNQYSFTASYSTSDSSTPSPSVVLTGTQYGSSSYLTLTTSSQTTWLDAGTTWYINNPIIASSTNERWDDVSETYGVVTGSMTEAPSYYHQYDITFGYGDQDSSVITSGSQIGSYYQFGSVLTINSGSSYGATSPVSDWVDAGSGKVSYQTFTSGSQRWALSSSPATFTVSSSTTISDTNFYHQYQLTVSTADFGTVSANGWFNVGTVQSVTATPPSVVSGEQYVFNGWTGTGSGSYTGTSNPCSVTMNAPITETASWTHQYYLTVSSAHGTTSGNGWYNNGSTAYAGLATGTVSGGAGTQYVFTSWSGDASGSNFAQSNGITMNSPKTATAGWQTQYQVTFAVSPSGTGSTSPVGVNLWENAGSLNITATPSTSYLFSSWSSTAGTVANTGSASTSVTISGSGTITANFLPIALNHFVFETVGSQVAGKPFTVTITAVDASGNTVTIYNGTPTLSYSAGSISPSSATGGFSNGVWTGSVTVTVAGADVTLSVADGPITGTSNTFAVNPGALDHITISPIVASIVAGSSEVYSSEGFDQYSNDLGAVTAAYSVNGVGITGSSVSETLVGSYTVTATYNGKTASTTLIVTAASLNHIGISPSSATIEAGNSQSYTATAYDKYGNSLGSVSATYRAAGASVTGNSVSATVAGSYMITATYKGLTSNTATLTVNPGPLNHFVINVPASATAGSSFSITITAMDAYRNTVTNFTGTVSLSVNHGSISPSTSGPFVGGTWVGSVTLTQTGSVAITVNGGNGHSVTSEAIAVSLISSSLMIIIVAVVIVTVIIVISIILVRRGSTKGIIVLRPKGNDEST